MRSAIVSVRSSKQRWMVPLVAVGLLVQSLFCWSVVAAVSTDVGVSICGDDVPAAGISISEPINDSVVSLAENPFRGTVENATQIEVTIDGQYNNTISIGANVTTFETSLTLSEGTHTISMTANAICGAPNATDSIVITYQPAVQPSAGNSTPTTLDGATTLDGTPVEQTIGIEQNDFAQQINQLPIIGAAINMVTNFADDIGLQATIAGNNTPVITGAARVGLTVVAITSVVMASTLAPIAATSIPGVSELFSVHSHRSMLYLEWVIRGLGVLALALAYFI